MASPDNYPPRKPRVAKADLSKLLAGSATSWMIFLLKDHGRLNLHGFVYCCGNVNWSCGFKHYGGLVNWSRVKHSRVLNKTCREIWDDIFQVRLCVPYGYAVAAIRDSVEHGSMMFYRLQDRDTWNKILCNNFGQGCLLTIPWRAFIKLDPISHSFVGQDVLLHMPSSHYLVPRATRYSFDVAERTPEIEEPEWPYLSSGKFDYDADDRNDQESNCGLLCWMERDEIVGVHGVQTFICVDYKGSRYLRNKGLGFVAWPDDFSADSDTNSCTYEE